MVSRRAGARGSAFRRAVLVSGLFAAFLAACASGPPPLREHHGARVYTQVNLWGEHDEHIATNYRIGWHLPINSPVEILDSTEETITVRAPEIGRRFTIHNEPAYTGEDIRGLYERYFGPEPVDLSGFSEVARRAIRNGRVREGMSKEAVLLARGYPPVHHTPSTAANTWTYWVGRFEKRRIEFDRGRVVRIVD